MNATIKRHKTYDRLGCPVEVTTEIIGGKWKGKIIYLLLSGKKRFGELRKLVGTATQRMLTAQLRQLESDGVVARKVYLEAPPKVEYSLTKRGRDLKPAIEAISFRVPIGGSVILARMLDKAERHSPETKTPRVSTWIS
jgi:DNA-binding HxlR family transcriptional regulator